jgi:hypothetical protein
MLHSSLFVVAMLIAGAASAQSTSDPAAVAPVVYSDAPAGSSNCNSGVYNADGTPVISCASADATANTEDGSYADEAPVYDDDADYYPGVSLLPADYWAGYGWPYYAYAPFAWGWPYYGFGYGYGYGYGFGYGWGWPYFGFAWNWGGGHGHHHHDGWDHNHDGGDHHHGGGDSHHDGGHQHSGIASRNYPGPYQYLGQGRYTDHIRNATTSVANATTSQRAASQPDHRAAQPAVNGASPATAHSASAARPGLSAPSRASLPSASYYALARGGGAAAPANRLTPSANRQFATSNPSGSRAAPTTRGQSQSYRVTGMPSRAYAPSNYHGYRGGTLAMSSRYSGAYGYHAPTASYGPPHYAGATRGGYAGHAAMPSYSHSGSYAHGGSGFSAHGGGGPTGHVSAGGHSSAGYSHH